MLRGDRAWCPAACQIPGDTLAPVLSSLALHTCTLLKHRKQEMWEEVTNGVLEVSGHVGELLPTFQRSNQKGEPGPVLLYRSQVIGA